MRLFKRRSSDPSPQLLSLPLPLQENGTSGAGKWDRRINGKKVSRVDSLRNLFSKQSGQQRTVKLGSDVSDLCQSGLDELHRELEALGVSNGTNQQQILHALMQNPNVTNQLRNGRSVSLEDIVQSLHNSTNDLSQDTSEQYQLGTLDMLNSNSCHDLTASHHRKVNRGRSLDECDTSVQELSLVLYKLLVKKKEETEAEERHKVPFWKRASKPKESRISVKSEERQEKKKIQTIRLQKDSTGELGVLIAKASGGGYMICGVEEGGLVWRDGRLQVGDELVKVNGTRLRGLSIQDARNLLARSPNNLELVISQSPENQASPTYERIQSPDLIPVRPVENFGRNQRAAPNERSKSSAYPNMPGRFAASAYRPRQGNQDRPLELSTRSPTTHNHTPTKINISRLQEQPKERHPPAKQRPSSLTSYLHDKLEKPTIAHNEAKSRPLPPMRSVTLTSLFARDDQCKLPPTGRTISKQPAVTGMKKFATKRSGSRPASPATSIRPRSLTSSLFTVTFRKGEGQKSLGFSIVGGKGSPKGDLGIFVRTIFSWGQAAEEGSLMAGDEIISVNGTALQGRTHAEAIQMFKAVKNGTLLLTVARRDKKGTDFRSCEQLNNLD